MIMKRITLLCLNFMLAMAVFAQVPQGISHQAVVRNAANELISNLPIGVKISILQGSAEGVSVYVEFHSVQSNSNGLISFVIGNGIIVTGAFSEIDWSNSPYFIKVEVDTDQSNSYSITGISEVLSVPYSQFSNLTSGLRNMTSEQRDSLGSPVAGTTIYNSTTNCLNYYSGFTWFELCGDCSPMPSEANAGNDQYYSTETNSTYLEANYPEIGTGLWQVISGNGWFFENMNDPNTIFTGNHCETYVLLWSITNACGVTSDEVIIQFNAEPTQSVAGSDIYIFDNDISVNLSGNFPETGQGDWSIVSGEDGVIEDFNDPTSLFTGKHCELYVLAWTISTFCSYSTSTLTLSFYSTPTQANAGEDQLGLSDTWTALEANTPENGIGQWIIASGEGGEIVDPFNPNSFFLGEDMQEYLLEWSISSACDTTRDEVIISFGYSPPPDCGDYTVSDSDGNIYNTVLVGDQCWMKENLKTTHYSNGTSIEYPGNDNNSWANNTNGAYAWYNNDISWKDSYGALYNWHAVNNSNGLCPEGWHVANDQDWTQLTGFIGGAAAPYGNKLKSCRQVNSPLGGECATIEHPRWDANSTIYGTDDFGHSTLPGGRRLPDGSFAGLGSMGYWWTSTASSPTNAWYRFLRNNFGSVNRDFFFSTSSGFSVRCFRDEGTMPSVITSPVHNISATAAYSGGIVTDHGGHQVTARGIVWGTDTFPTIESNTGLTMDGEGVGIFTSTMTNLIPETTYFVRAYATNSKGTCYGDEYSFTTLIAFACGVSTVSDIDNNTYPTVLIGGQCWMTKNLKTTRYGDGTEIDNPGNDSNAWNSNTSGAYALYNNDEDWKNKYGALYNWYAINNSNGLCPEGWSIPNDEDWIQLTSYITGGEANGGNQLKSCRQVNSPLGNDCDTDEHPRWNEHIINYGTNDYGLSVLPGGYRNSEGIFGSIGSNAYFWTASQIDNSDAWYRTLVNSFSYVYRHHLTKTNGFSIRCIRDESGQTLLPEVLTLPVSSITDISAISGGNVVNDGGAPVTSRGIVWDTIENPTIDNNQGFTSDGCGTGLFESNLEALAPQTIYYMRAYATTIAGTAYGNQIMFFTTDPSFLCGVNVISDIDGNSYSTVLINNKCWMKENLKVTQYNDGTPVDYPGPDISAWQNNTTGAYAWHNNNIDLKDAYGALYNWSAVNNPANICPTGWHVPNNDDWTQLLDYVIAQGYPNQYNNPYGAGNAKKSCRQDSSPLGDSCATTEHPRWDASSIHFGFDAFGFAALPGGSRYISGLFSNIGDNGYWWSSSGEGSTEAWARRLRWESASLNSIYYSSAYGFSVRCMQDETQIPTVITTDVSAISAVTAESGGNVTSDGGAEVSIRGVCWSTIPNPTTSDNHTINGNGSGVFVSQLTSLSPETTYYIRAYAINSAGTGYGNELIFTTNPTSGQPCPDMPTVTDVDGNSYNTVLIGDICWMKDNLKTTKYRNGEVILNAGNIAFNWSSNTAGAYTWYNNDIMIKSAYGGLYNWQAVINSSGLCPEGWRIPGDAEFTNLTDYIEGNTAEKGNLLKSCRQINSPLGGDCDTDVHPRWNEHSTHHGTDNHSFSALPGGIRNSAGIFDQIGSYGYLWSFNESSAGSAWYRGFLYNYGGVFRSSGSKNNGFAVRCIWNDPSKPGPAEITTDEANNITLFTAESGGNVISDGGSDVISKGLVWHTTENPTIYNNEGFSDNGSGIGLFTASLTNLESGTTYYVRAYATNSVFTAYGNQISFTTPGPPLVTTAEVTGVTASTATGGGNVIDSFGSAVIRRGVCWSTSPHPTIENDTTHDGSGTGSFISYIDGLEPAMVYYLRAYAVNSFGVGYGNQVVFNTDNDIPRLTTYSITDVTSSSAKGGGFVCNDGGLPVTHRGVCWGSDPYPTIENDTTINGSGVGSFISNLAGLLPNATYYVRAYAINSLGTAYGNEVNFHTIEPCPGIPTVADIDGNVYNTVFIGSQCFMAENLKVTKSPSGGVITRYCYDNNNDWCDIYGGLYNWATIMNGQSSSNTNPSGVQGICPAGWHIPSFSEWQQLQNFVSNPAHNGNMLKSCRQIGSPKGGSCNTEEHPRWNSHATHYGTNHFGFSGLPAGQMAQNGAFSGLGEWGKFWSSHDDGLSNVAWHLNLYYYQGNLDYSDHLKTTGLSVRCIKD